jgi:peptidoglycan/LPS O-acetylase OafA/YrhL
MLPANLLLVHAWGFTNHGSFNNASWSISAEFFLYLLFPFLAFLVDRLHPLLNLAAIVVFVAIMEFTRHAFGLLPWTTATYDFGMARAVPTFFFGVLLAGCLPFRVPYVASTWAFAYALFAAALIAMQMNVPDEITIVILSGLIVVCTAAEARSNSGLLLSRPFVLLGNASYSIYMVHGLVLIPVILVLKKTFGLGTFAAGFAGLAALAATFLISILVYRHFEDPARRFFSGLPRGVAKPLAQKSSIDLQISLQR